MPSSRLLDLATWPRREAFDHFRRLGQPCFSVCARVDVSSLAGRLRLHSAATWFLAYHHAALQALNAVEAFRYRLDGDQVRIHERIAGSTTVPAPGERLGFATLHFDPDFARFVEQSLPAVAAAKAGRSGFAELTEDAAVVHMTTIPWLDFSSFSHARQAGGADSIPKLAFGKIVSGVDGRRTMAVAVEVHHALMDGLHVGRFYAELQRALDGDSV